MFESCRVHHFSATSHPKSTGNKVPGVAALKSPSPRADLMLRAMLSTDLQNLCDPELYSLAAALDLARFMKDAHPLLDIELAQMTPPKQGEMGENLPTAKVERALEILDVISKGGRILNRLVHLLQSENERIRSKAALLIGRRVGNAHWARKAENDANHRVRANVIEALWDSPLPQCRDMFYRALLDSDNRVVGNAIYGIYRISPGESVPLVVNLAGHDQLGCRVTAAWVMGKTGDWQFHGLLQKMIRDPEAKVRSMALKSMFLLKKARQTSAAA